jgi:rhodanese-related sulfurtransferase
MQQIDAAHVQQLLDEIPNLVVLDVRTEEEFAHLGHLTQAKLIPLHELPYGYRMLEPETPVLVYCQHGVRSVDACYFLNSQGFTQLYNLAGGLSTWTGALAYGKTEEQAQA